MDMKYIFLLGYSLIAFSPSAYSALSPESNHALDALAPGFSVSSRRMIVSSLKNLCSDPKDVPATRRVEAFIRALSNHPQALQTIYDVHRHEHYFRTGHASLDKKEWNTMLRAALAQSVAHPRASVYHWFKCESQDGLHSDFLQGGMCKGLSILKILLHGKTQESIDYTRYRETKEIIPFSELLSVVASLSEPWFQRTYQSLRSGRRPSSAKDRIDQIIFRSLVKFFQEDITAAFDLPKLIEYTAPHLRSPVMANHTFNMNDRQEALDFFKCVLPQHERFLLNFMISSEESGHAVTVIQDKEGLFLWDSNGFSFQSPDISKFTENFFRLVQHTYPEKEDTSDQVSTLELSIHGVNTIGSALDVPIQLDPRYKPPSQLPHEVDFITKMSQNPATGALKMEIDTPPFLSLLKCPLPHYSQASLTPFLVQAMFKCMNGSEQGGPECRSKAMFLATPYSKAWEAFGKAFWKDFALVRAFEAVGKFCEKSYDLPLPKHGREAYTLCFERIASFYEIVHDQLNNLGNLSHVTEAFNIPEAKAIAKNFSRASFQNKAQLLDNYVLASTERIKKAQALRIEAFQQRIRALREEHAAYMQGLGT